MSINGETRGLSPDPAFWAGKRVLVTGHTGFKGSWLTLWLTRLGAAVTGLALAPNTQPSLFSLALADGAASHIADIRDLAAVQTCFETARPEIVLHLAAQALVRPSYADPVGTYATNVMGTVHVLEAARACFSVRTVVVVTSDKAYENREWPWAYRETEALGGFDPYSNSKGCAELVVSAYRNSFFAESGVRVASARAGNVIGGGDWSVDRLIPDIVRAFERSQSVEIRSPGAIRPWQHVLEPLAGYLALAERLSSADAAGFSEAWNFGPTDEDCRAVSYIIDQMVKNWGGAAGWHLSEKTHAHEAHFLKVDSSKARARLGWDRRLRLDDALAWTTQWYRDHDKGASARDLTLAQIEAYERLA
ncbi:CDP-glucose 4,6-dehydratase [Beijerinckia sp. L45]|uniref:CDP-glucose 4,6-dehydratase n=1 Tax=Beijerinckia sp. L45 TaxID=1641855 RepID=UPI001FF03A9D|nr:CDP-glucose 4,6-dehydratase [Beijerinckia sp. L45]